jgi:predicted transposase/invertase (TIGR01784 family)
MPGKKPTIPNPHDRFFRGIMQQQPVAIEFFQAFLPKDVLQHIDLDSIKATSSSFVEPELSEQVNDLLFECQFKQDEGSVSGYVYLLVEHQSRAEKLLPLRVFRYVLAALDKHAKQHPNKPLPPVYPMVFYQGERSPYPYSLNLLDLFDDPLSLMKQVLFQPVSLIDVNQLDMAQLKRFSWLQPATGLMQHIRDEDITAILVELLNQCLHLMNHPNGVDFLDFLLHYAVEAGNIIDATEFYHISEQVPAPVKEKVMTIADMLKQHGWEQGLAEGIEKGREEGIEKGIEKGIEQGALANKRENAMAMLKLGSDVEFVCKVTGLSLEEVKRLSREIAPKH